MPRGRPPNVPRMTARAAGLKTYIDPTPCFCGSDEKYVSNARCVACSIYAARNRYANLDADALAELKAKDKARYTQRLLAGKEPGHS